MKTLHQVQRDLAGGRFEFSHHALHRVVERNIAEAEIKEASEAAELIEDYPNDKYSPSGLLLGFTRAGRPLHIQVSFCESDNTKIITLYEPDSDEWVDNRKRR